MNGAARQGRHHAGPDVIRTSGEYNARDSEPSGFPDHDARTPAIEVTDPVTGTGLTAVARQVVLFALGHVHALNDVVATRAAQIAIDYHAAGTVIGPRGKAGSHVGEHLATGPVAIADLVGSGHRVFAFGANAEERAALGRQLGQIGEVREGDQVLATALGTSERGLSAIRPAGYIGLVADSPDPAALHDYLTRCLHAPATSPIP